MQNVQDYPVAAIAWASAQMSQFGRVGATRILKFPDLAAPIPAAGATPTVATPALLTFRDPGTVIALYGQERRGTVAAFASTEINIQFTGDEFLISNGNGPDYAALLALVGPNVNWFPITRRAKRGDNWQVLWRNQDTGAAANPQAMFAFIRDADLGALQQEYQAYQAQAR